MTSARGPAGLRAARDALVANTAVGGAEFGAALTRVVDASLREALAAIDADVAVVALGSYARGELCPGSDIDAVLVHADAADIQAVADALWYPLWDAGMVLGHATRTVKESRTLAAHDLDTLTALVEGRVVGGRAPELGDRVIADAQALAVKQSSAVVARLADDAVLRELKPGPVAEMLEPNLKDGAGGLRDLHALGWVGWCLGGPGLTHLVELGVLHPDDLTDLDDARAALLTARVALHRVTGGRSDVLALQEHDAVARSLGHGDADAMARSLASMARRVAWIASDTWPRLRIAASGRPRRIRAARSVAPGVELRDGQLVVLDPTAYPGGDRLLELARLAVEHRAAIERATLRGFRGVTAPTWTDTSRADFVAVLAAGRSTLDVFAALDHEDLVRVILPEWASVRFRPQRNAYHRFTVDRHLVETVIEASELLAEAGPAPTGAVPAARPQQPELLLLGALLHDIAKGRPGDHSEVGAGLAETIGSRMGLDTSAVATLVWLVRDHLLMADTATRRDLADPVTIVRFADRVGSADRLVLLTLLTVADSRATGPAAWGPGKAALVRELHDRTLAYWTGMPPVDGAMTNVADRVLDGAGVVVDWTDLGGDRWRCSVGADDRRGLLADVAGALSLEGFDIDAAEGHSYPAGRAVEVFDGTDPFERLADDNSRARAAATICAVLDGERSVAEGLRERRTAYAGAGFDPEAVRVVVAPEESAPGSTVVEVYAPDAIGLLATVAGVFAGLDLDVSVVRAATTGELAVDVFYVRDEHSALADAAQLARLDRALRDALARE